MYFWRGEGSRMNRLYKMVDSTAQCSSHWRGLSCATHGDVWILTAARDARASTSTAPLSEIMDGISDI